jgi:hypothetical protein
VYSSSKGVIADLIVEIEESVDFKDVNRVELGRKVAAFARRIKKQRENSPARMSYERCGRCGQRHD